MSSSASRRHAPGSRADVLGLVAWVVGCFAVSAAGALFTASSVDTWYQTLTKPDFNPPDWLFAPVWTALYAMMAVAAWRVWRRVGPGAGRWPLGLFAVQLGLNLLWSILFFGQQQIGLALGEIAVLLVAIVVTAAAFWRVDRLAAALLVPYALWVAFASVLNAALWSLNGS